MGGDKFAAFRALKLPQFTFPAGGQLELSVPVSWAELEATGLLELSVPVSLAELEATGLLSAQTKTELKNAKLSINVQQHTRYQLQPVKATQLIQNIRVSVVYPDGRTEFSSLGDRIISSQPGIIRQANPNRDGKP